MLQPLLSAKETRRLLGISKATLWRLTKTGALRPVRIGRRTLFRPEDVVRFIEDRLRET